MATQALPVQDNGASAFISSLMQNGTSLFGSGKTTTSTSTAQPNLQPLDNDTMDAMIQGILDKAKTAFGPNISNSIAAGNRALSDTTLSDMQSRAAGYATAQAASSKIQAITAQNQIAAQVATANKTTTVQTKASPLGQAASLAGIASTGYSLYKNLTKKDPATMTGVEDLFKDPTTSGPTQWAGTDISTINAGNIGNEGVSLTSPEFANTGLVDSVFNVGASNALQSGIPAVDNADATAAIGDSTAAAAGTDTAAIDLFAPTTGDAVTFGAGGEVASGGGVLAGDIAAGGVATTATEAGIGETLAEVLPATWVICTELKRQNLLDKELYLKTWNTHIKYLPEQMKEGYRFWAVPYVKLMKHSKYGKFFTKLVCPLAQGRIDYLSGKRNFLGWATVAIGEPVCHFIGKCLNSSGVIHGRT